MRIWKPYTDPGSRYASAAELPSPYSRQIVCPKCHAVLGHEDRPLRIYWSAGSDVVGDAVFVPSAHQLVVTERLMRFLMPFGGLTAHAVEIEDNPNEKATRRRPKVQLSYAGPVLFEVRASRLVPFDRVNTRAKPIRRSDGHDAWRFEGCSYVDTRYDHETNTLTKVLVPRSPGGGIHVRDADLEGDGFFGLVESRGLPLYVTDKVREGVLSGAYTNLDFLEAGETTPSTSEWHDPDYRA